MSIKTVLILALILLVETSVASFASFFLKKSSGVDNKIEIIKSHFSRTSLDIPSVLPAHPPLKTTERMMPFSSVSISMLLAHVPLVL